MWPTWELWEFSLRELVWALENYCGLYEQGYSVYLRVYLSGPQHDKEKLCPLVLRNWLHIQSIE